MSVALLLLVSSLSLFLKETASLTNPDLISRSDSRRTEASRSLVLWYKSESTKNDAAETPTQQQTMSIPVVGPIPGKPPLMIGSEMVLTPPTPMQWLTIQEAAQQHEKHQQGNAKHVPGISAAPIVAVIDDYTKDGTGKERYATLAAITGRRRQKKSSEEFIDSKLENTRLYGDQYDREPNALDDHVVLLGIGRVKLSDFKYQVPSNMMENDNGIDKDGYLIENETDASKFVVANLMFLKDDEPTSSPVHAINRMSQLANRIQRIHDDRRKLVAGLSAAKARLQFAGVEDLEDYDGLGMLSSQNYEEEKEASQAAIDFLLEDYSGIEENTNDVSTSDSARIHDLENFGLGFAASSVCTLPQLTRTLMDRLVPYYSPSLRSTEEHFFELLSFCCIQAMEHVLEPQDVSRALQYTSTIERLERARELMWLHARDLKREAEKISAELRECGEECTDLW